MADAQRTSPFGVGNCAVNLRNNASTRTANTQTQNPSTYERARKPQVRVKHAARSARRKRDPHMHILKVHSEDLCERHARTSCRVCRNEEKNTPFRDSFGVCACVHSTDTHTHTSHCRRESTRSIYFITARGWLFFECTYARIAALFVVRVHNVHARNNSQKKYHSQTLRPRCWRTFIRCFHPAQKCAYRKPSSRVDPVLARALVLCVRISYIVL